MVATPWQWLCCALCLIMGLWPQLFGRVPLLHDACGEGWQITPGSWHTLDTSFSSPAVGENISLWALTASWARTAFWVCFLLLQWTLSKSNSGMALFYRLWPSIMEGSQAGAKQRPGGVLPTGLFCLLYYVNPGPSAQGWHCVQDTLRGIFSTEAPPFRITLARVKLTK